MEIRSNNNSHPDRRTVERNRAHARAFKRTLANFNRVAPAEAGADGATRTDRVDLSDSAKSLRNIVARYEQAGHEIEREDVQQLKQLYRDGQLNSPERIQQAAARLLGGE